MVHYKANRIAAFAAPKAFINSLANGHMKRGRFLVMERTKPDQAGSPAFQRHEIANHIFYAGGFNNLINGFFWNQDSLAGI